MGEITELLQEVAKGANEGSPGECRDALDEVFRRLHSELKILAASRLRRAPNQTLTPTGLVNELYLKLAAAQKLDLESQQHFYACAAAAMRQIVVDAARSRSASKRGGSVLFVTLDDQGATQTDEEIIALDHAMQDLAKVDHDLVALVEMRFFAGLSLEQIAEIRNRSTRSLRRDWTRARAFLHAQLAT